MPIVKKIKGLIYVAGYPGMTREEYERVRTMPENKEGPSWPSYEALIDLDPEPLPDDGPSPSL